MSRKKKTPGYHSNGMTKRNVIKGIARNVKNGKQMTLDQVKKIEQMSYETAMKQCAEMATKQLYAAAALAAKQEFGFGAQRCMRLMRAMDKFYIECIYSDELVEKVWKDLGIEMSFHSKLTRDDLEGTTLEAEWDRLTEMEV